MKKPDPTLKDLEQTLLRSLIGERWTRSSLEARVSDAINGMTGEDIPVKDRLDHLSTTIMSWVCAEHESLHADPALQDQRSGSFSRLAASQLVFQVASAALDEVALLVSLRTLDRKDPPQ